MPAFSALNQGSALNPRTLNPGTTVLNEPKTEDHFLITVVPAFSVLGFRALPGFKALNSGN